MDFPVANTILYCKKWEETVLFYRDRLNLVQTVDKSWFAEFRLNSAARLSVADASRASVGAVGGRGVTITLRVDDIEEMADRLKASGLNPPAAVEHPWGAKVIRIHDPEGTRLEFWAPR
jgi:predicted enzyme related to lactoylglutathione lyase